MRRMGLSAGRKNASDNLFATCFSELLDITKPKNNGIHLSRDWFHIFDTNGDSHESS